jgi:hypothetical protein
MSRFDQASRKALLTLGAASLTVTGLLAACGGGDSSGPPPPPSSSGNTIPPSSGPGDAENFFPNATGNAWYYDTTTTLISGPTATSMDRILLTGQKSVLGKSSSVFQDTVIQDPTTPAAPTEDYYFKNAGGVSYMGSNAPNDALSAAFVPYIEVLFPVAPATVASFGKSNVNAGDLDGDGKSDTATLTLTAKVEDFEALDTALGSLPRTGRTTESLFGQRHTVLQQCQRPALCHQHHLERSGHRRRQAHRLGHRSGKDADAGVRHSWLPHGHRRARADNSVRDPERHRGQFAGLPGRAARPRDRRNAFPRAREHAERHRRHAV